MKTKVLILGCGGIGSRLVEELAELVDGGFISGDFTIADGDMVEPTQLKPVQNFVLEDIGHNKALSLSKRFDYFRPYAFRIDDDAKLEGYDMIICCADNETTRANVVRYCFENGKEFIILTATGRNCSAYPKEDRIEDTMKYINAKDKREYSCQDKAEMKKGWLQMGNRVIASVGVQMLLNSNRGIRNTPINIRV